MARVLVTVCDRCGVEHRHAESAHTFSDEAPDWALVFPAAVTPLGWHVYPSDYTAIEQVCGDCLTNEERDRLATLRGREPQESFPW
jgi:hypothetical protein